MKYVSTKFYKDLGPCAYRQWRADTHCNLIHGYSFSFYFEFESDTVDVRNWVIDFGGLRPLKEQLEDWFDHTLLVAENDPHRDELMKLQELGLAKITEVEATGCEALATFLYEWINTIFMTTAFGPEVADRVWCRKVMVQETEKNMAFVEGTRADLLEWEQKLTHDVLDYLRTIYHLPGMTFARPGFPRRVGKTTAVQLFMQEVEDVFCVVPNVQMKDMFIRDVDIEPRRIHLPSNLQRSMSGLERPSMIIFDSCDPDPRFWQTCTWVVL